jgi:hypothetical protein
MQTTIQVTTRSFGFTTPVSIGPGFRGRLNVVGRCAFDKDACGELTADLLARSADGRLWLCPGNGQGGVTGRQPVRGGEGVGHVVG